MVRQINRLRNLFIIAGMFVVSILLPAHSGELLYSYYSDAPQKYLEKIKELETTKFQFSQVLPGNVLAGIVPHHFIAGSLMADLFKQIASRTQPKRVILIGPNHSGQGGNAVIISALPWKTPFGILQSDKKCVKGIVNRLKINEEDNAFRSEHSVALIVPFIKYYFPKSQLIPIIIKADAPYRAVSQLRDLISELLSDHDTIVLLSMDFSHFSTEAVSEQRDKNAETAIERLDATNIEKLNLDCHNGLRILIEAMNRIPDVKACIRAHANSEKITGQIGQTDVTSYFTVLFVRKIE